MNKPFDMVILRRSLAFRMGKDISRYASAPLVSPMGNLNPLWTIALTSEGRSDKQRMAGLDEWRRVALGYAKRGMDKPVARAAAELLEDMAS